MAILKLSSNVISLEWTSTYCLSFYLISLSSPLNIEMAAICSSLRTEVLMTVLVTVVVVAVAVAVAEAEAVAVALVALLALL
jgi:hypothetical protein